MLTFPEGYFQNETRCGFHITAMMKRFWASQLEVLSWVDSVCRKYGIRYIICYGSLIGAVRHKGFIPWDDDIDFAMLRNDFNRFMEVLPLELPPYLSSTTLLPGATPPKEMTFGIGNGTRLDTSRVFLERFHGCPYVVNIDLYVFDRIPDDPDDFAYQDRLIRLLDRLLMLQWEVDDKSISGEEYKEYNAILKTIESELAHTFTDNEPMKLQILRILDLACALCEDCGSARVGNREQMLYYKDPGFREEYFTDTILVPYENVMNVPIPRASDKILHDIFGNYEIPLKFTSQHAYPSYHEQRDILYKEHIKRGLDIPEDFLEYDENGHLVVDPRTMVI
ncbi:MAG: LicD family protein [Lachnospiraceae bacterium]|nr:LicD family protein [Lachnospiraceae bacterium]